VISDPTGNGYVITTIELDCVGSIQWGIIADVGEAWVDPASAGVVVTWSKLTVCEYNNFW
jgi:hypothetical protein